MADRERVSDQDTFDQLSDILIALFPEGTIKRISEADVQDFVEEFGTSCARNDLVVDTSSGLIIAVLSNGSRQIVGGLALNPNGPVTDATIRFAGKITETFVNDLRAAPRKGQDNELWISLQATLFSRAIAKFSSFHTEIFTRWILMFEAASHLRYEGQKFCGRLILVKKKEWINENSALSFIPFENNIPLSEILFDQKWTRSLMTSEDTCIVGYGHDRGIIGIAITTGIVNSDTGTNFSPHQDLENWCSSLIDGTIGFLITPVGDLFIIQPDGTWFIKSQGRWRIANGNDLQRAIAPHMNDELSTVISRLAQDLSFEGQGALFCILDQPELIKELVPDHLISSQTNQGLRSICNRIEIENVDHQKLVMGAATIDGSVIFGSAGKLLDLACMIGDPSEEALRRCGLNQKQRFEGSRETAAWNASLYGTSIKVSEDGPISVFRFGKKIFQVG